MNATSTAYNTMASASSSAISWVVTAILFISILAILFFLSKNIRNFFYGAAFTALFYIVGYLSRFIGKEAVIENNPEPLYIFFKIGGFIILSIVLGWIARKLPAIKRFEEKLKEEK